MKNTNQPECAKWNLWRGVEIEGQTDVGVPTLFVRNATKVEIFSALDSGYKLTRVWLCEEFLKGEDLIEMCCWLLAFKRGLSVAVAVKIGDVITADTARLKILQKFTSKLDAMKAARFAVYYKLQLKGVREGDHICVGNAFADEAFRIGDGRKVTPDMYKDDTFIA